MCKMGKELHFRSHYDQMTRYVEPSGQCLAHRRSSKNISCLLLQTAPHTLWLARLVLNVTPVSFPAKLPMLLPDRPSRPTAGPKVSSSQFPLQASNSKPSRKCHQGAPSAVPSARWSLKNNSKRKMSVLSPRCTDTAKHLVHPQISRSFPATH